MKLVEKKLAILESQKSKLNNGSIVLNEISQLLRSEVVQAIDKANKTDSVDGRITSLVSGLQGVLDILTKFGNDFAQKTFVFDTKISTLEEVLDSYIAEGGNDLDEE